MLIRRMKPLGFSLDEMSELLKIIGARRARQTNDVVAASYQRFVDETVSRRAKLEQQLAMADEFLELLRQN